LPKNNQFFKNKKNICVRPGEKGHIVVDRELSYGGHTRSNFQSNKTKIKFLGRKKKPRKSSVKFEQLYLKWLSECTLLYSVSKECQKPVQTAIGTSLLVLYKLECLFLRGFLWYDCAAKNFVALFSPEIMFSRLFVPSNCHMFYIVNLSCIHASLTVENFKIVSMC